MRTTITLDPDVAVLVEKELAKGEKTFKQLVNDALRRGLGRQHVPKRRFVQRTWNGGGSPSPAEIKQILLDDDIEAYLETDRRKPASVRD